MLVCTYRPTGLPLNTYTLMSSSSSKIGYPFTIEKYESGLFQSCPLVPRLLDYGVHDRLHIYLMGEIFYFP